MLGKFIGWLKSKFQKKPARVELSPLAGYKTDYARSLRLEHEYEQARRARREYEKRQAIRDQYKHDDLMDSILYAHQTNVSNVTSSPSYEGSGGSFSGGGASDSYDSGSCDSGGGGDSGGCSGD